MIIWLFKTRYNNPILLPRSADLNIVSFTRLSFTRADSHTRFLYRRIQQENQRVEASWSKYVATTHGVPGEAIQIDESAVLSTYDEAVLLKNYIDAHADTISSVTVVTDPYHSRRARWIYQKVLGDEIKVVIAPVPRARTDFPKQ